MNKNFFKFYFQDKLQFEEEKMIFLISFISKKEALPIAKPCDDSILRLLAFYILHPDHRIFSAKLILFAISCFKNEQTFLLPTVSDPSPTLFVDFFQKKEKLSRYLYSFSRNRVKNEEFSQLFVLVCLMHSSKNIEKILIACSNNEKNLSILFSLIVSSPFFFQILTGFASKKITFLQIFFQFQILH
jgi:hypothetical protein